MALVFIKHEIFDYNPKITYLPPSFINQKNGRVEKYLSQEEGDVRVHWENDKFLRSKPQEGDIEIVSLHYHFYNAIPLYSKEALDKERARQIHNLEKVSKITEADLQKTEFEGFPIIIKNSFKYGEFYRIREFMQNIRDNSTINPPECIRYARKGYLDDILVYFNSEEILVALPGEIEFGVN